MNINAETDLLNELITVQEQIEICFDRKDWAQVERIDENCRETLEKINEFAKSGASMLLKLQVDSLIKSYRELLTRSIFEQDVLQRTQDHLQAQKVELNQVEQSFEVQSSIQ